MCGPLRAGGRRASVYVGSWVSMGIRRRGGREWPSRNSGLGGQMSVVAAGPQRKGCVVSAETSSGRLCALENSIMRSKHCGVGV